jgi:hypothetical protein
MFVEYVSAAVKYCDLPTSDVITYPEQVKQEAQIEILIWTFCMKEKTSSFSHL